MSLVIHQSGIEAAINAQANGFSGATLSDVDLYNGNTLIKRLPLKGVQVIEPTRIYVVAVDETVGSAYDVTRMEFRTDGNVLYATAQLADGGIIQSKGPYTTLMLTEQINLSAAPGTIAPSGDLSLYAPQATEEMLGAAEIATQEEVDTGADHTRFVTPKTWLQALKNKLSSAINSTSTTTPANSAAVKSAYDRGSQALADGTRQATESLRGQMEIATQAEVNAGSDTTRALVPSKLKAWWDSVRTWDNIKNKPETATRWPKWNEVTEKLSAFPPVKHDHAGTEVAQASESVRGTAEIATQTETNNGVDNTRMVTPSKLRAGFAYSMGYTGYIVFPQWLGRFTFQWGYVYVKADGTASVTLPLSMTRIFSAYASRRSTINNHDDSCGVTMSSPSVIVVSNAHIHDGYDVQWLVLGAML